LDIAALLPQFGGLLYTIAAFIVALSIIVAIHEYGHYIVGRWSGIHAEVFSVGFGPALWGRVDRRGTRWQIAALPFGGYVKFAGDADPASGKDAAAMAEVAQDPAALRRTMHGAPLWARTATVAAGPIFNFILSITVFALIFMVRGQTAEPLAVGEILPLPEAGYALQAGDEVLAIQGQILPDPENPDAPRSFDAMVASFPVQPVLGYTILRDGQEMTVPGPYLQPAYVGAVIPRSAAYDAGMRPGDVIVGLNGEPVYAFSQLKTAVESSNGAALPLTVWRDGEELALELTPRRTDEPLPEGGFQTQWRIGIASALAFEPATETVGFGAALSGGVRQTIGIVEGSLSGLWHMVTGAISTCNMSGPIGIAETSGAMASQGAGDFIWFIALLSTAVGMLNLFPIPALDGGHLVFYAYEAVTGKPPSDRWMNALMTFGMALVLTLMVFALGNDLFC